MDTVPKTNMLDLKTRLARSVGRAGRDQMANARVTVAERQELHAAARAQSKSLSEWSREVLLREARRAEDDALFTEVIATRLLLTNLIKPLITGQKVSEEWVSQAMSAVRKGKRKAAAEVRQQYQSETAGGE